ncbi:MAG: methionyl-tRNA formyltransferase [Gammaproteobacteria bacterium]|nr:MAG: methionyl-tRNA formyltransferase [Gammaproteobacteria bacterium]
MRIVFAGTPEFAVTPLNSLVAAGHEIVAVYTQPDRPAGRGRSLTASPVKIAAVDQRLTVVQPHSLEGPQDLDQLTALNPEVMVVVAYGLILPRSMLEIPAQGCLNIHASLLPRWRGAAPIPRAIEAGDSKTGITIMQMDAGLDTGDILLSKEIPITDTDTTGKLHDRLSELGGQAITEALDLLASGGLSAKPQDEKVACYAPKLGKSEADIDWRHPAVDLQRKIRAFNPWPVTSTCFQKKLYRIWGASPLHKAIDGGEAGPGQIVDINKQGIHVCTGDGVLILTRMQAPGGRVLDAKTFANGQRLKIGSGFHSQTSRAGC